MKELSLHILDLARNSIDAEANVVKIKIVENTNEDLLSIEIEDDGKGMDEELLEKATDPFTTTRNTRKVGLGLPLAKEAAKHCGGDFVLQSVKGKGTRVYFSFKHSHIDRAPLGDMGESIMSLINSERNVDIYYEHVYNSNVFVFDTKKIKNMLGDLDIKNPQVLIWIKEYINDNVKKLQ